MSDLGAVPVPGRLQAILDTRVRDRWVVIVAVALAILPIAVAAVRALGDGWVAVGDDADLLLRSRDVLTSHHPWLGTWTSASLTIGTTINNPGPLLFDLLALPAHVGGSGGFAVGVALVNAACIAGIGFFGARVGGPRVALAGVAAAAGLSWTMGSELLFDAWQPHSLLLPFLFLLLLVVAMVLGDRLALPVAAGVASLIVQTHLSYAVLVPPLCAWGVVWLLRRYRRDLTRSAVAAVVVLGVCWLQPAVDQVIGEQNLTTLASNAGGASSSVGPTLGARLAADVVATPPWWSRPSFGDALLPPTGQPPVLNGTPNIGGLPSARVAVIGLAVVFGLLAVAWSTARRRRDVAGRAIVAVAGLALAGALVASAMLPVGRLGIAAHQLRFLWPIAAFSTAALALVALPRRYVVAALLGVTATLAVLNVPAHNARTGPVADADAIPVVRELVRQLGALQDEGTVLYDTSGLRFAEPWTSSVMAALQERGIDFDVDDEGWVAQVGTSRRDHGAAKVRVFVREGNAAEEVPKNTRRVAFVEGLEADQANELARLERQLIDLPISLTAAGRRARDAGGLPSFVRASPTAEQLLSTGELSVLVRMDLVRVPPARSADVRRYADLRHRWDRHTVAVFVGPR
jgi:hypothetical protein